MSLKHLTSSTQTRRSKTARSKYDFETCRICLTQVSSQSIKVDLQEPLQKGNDELLVFEALEEVMGDKIIQLENFSTCICGMCLGLLKIAYNLKEQYYKSKNYLMGKISTLEDSYFYESQRTKKDQTNQNDLTVKKMKGDLEPSVDLVLGNHTYSMNELLVVEDPVELPENDYTGFLNNLGTAISASLVHKNGLKSPSLFKNKSNQKPDLEILPLGTSQTESDNASDSNNETSLNIGEDRDPLQSIFKCPYCQISFESKDYFSEHMAICEKFSKNTCYICDEQLYSLAKLLKHVQSAHSLAKNIEPPKGKGVDFVPPGTYVCDVCGTIKKSQTSLKYHIMQFHKDGKRFTCEDCGMMFYFAYKLQIHQQKHKKSEVLEVCSICAKTFHYTGGLASHMRLHIQDYKYQCRFCEKKFIRYFSLTNHERIHTGEKPYSCSFCDKLFRRYNEFRTHERRMHTGERPFSCTLCEKTYVTSNNLKVHMFQHRGPFECQLCLKGFVNKEILSYHARRVHKITEEENDKEPEMLKNTNNENEELTEESSQESDVGEES